MSLYMYYRLLTMTLCLVESMAQTMPNRTIGMDLRNETQTWVDCQNVGQHCLLSLEGMNLTLQSMHPSLCRDHLPAVKCFYQSMVEAGCLTYMSHMFSRLSETVEVDVDTHIAMACEFATESCQAVIMASCVPFPPLPQYVTGTSADVADLPDVGNMNLRLTTPAIYKVCSELCMPVMVDGCPVYAELYLDTVIDVLSLPRTDERKDMIAEFIKRSCRNVKSFDRQIVCVDEQLYSIAFAECLASALDVQPMADERTVNVDLYELVERCVQSVTTVTERLLNL